jgi:hypothetical protein
MDFLLGVLAWLVIIAIVIVCVWQMRKNNRLKNQQKKCPYRAEYIKKGAAKCKFGHSEV